MLRDDGKWQGTQVLPAGWVDTAPGLPALATIPGIGLGWFVEAEGGFSHTGDPGAFLFVLPAKGIVAAGVHRPSGDIGSVIRDVQALTLG